MKKLRIFLPIFLISLFFIPKVFAYGISNYDITIKYDSTISNLVSNNQTKIDNLRTYLGNINSFGSSPYPTHRLSSGNYALAIYNMDNTSTWRVALVNVNSTSGNTYPRMAITQGVNEQPLYFNWYIGSASGIYLNVNFNGNNVTGHTIYQQSNSSIGGTNRYGINGTSSNPGCNAKAQNCTLEINNFWVDTYFLNSSRRINFVESANNSEQMDIPINVNNVVNIPTIYINAKELLDSFGESEPSYTYTTEVLDTGSVKLNLTLSNYTEGIDYGYEMYNYVSGEYYGIANPFGNYPNIVPYGSSYSITVPFDTSIYIRLYKYENNSRELINQNVIDLNNIVFENPQDPYFKILDQSNNRIRGIFENTKSGYSCYYSNSNNNIVGVVICDEEEVNEVFNFNGYVNFYIENQNGHIIYSRKVNVLGADSTPYIIYSVEKQDFYNVIKWEVKNKNLDPNMKYRYSTNNGTSYSEWETIGNEYKNINVYSNTTAIIQISNSDNTTIYDSKAINVIENLNTLKTFNKSSSNLINIFNNMFNVNSNILTKITELWNNIRSTKAYLIIFIPFISTLIGGIIYLIRRK